jgi:sulfonate transport system permease protein
MTTVAQETNVAARSVTVRPRTRRLGPGRRIPYGRLAGPLLLLTLWIVLSAAGRLDTRKLSAPWTIAATTRDLWASGRLPDSLLISLQRAAVGLSIGIVIGTVLAVAAGLSRAGEALVDGTIQVQRAVPFLGLLPLLILWLGIGEGLKVTVIALGVTVSIYINTYAALSGIDSRYVELAEVIGLSRWQFLRQVVIPGALPGFFVGLRLGVTGSWLALVVVEQINATSGLGYLMFQAQQYGQSDVIVVGLLAYGLIGFVSDTVVRLMERRVLSWRRTLAS